MNLNITELVLKIQNDLTLVNYEYAKDLAEYFLKLLVEYGKIEESENLYSILDALYDEIHSFKYDSIEKLDIDSPVKIQLKEVMSDWLDRIFKVL